MIGQEACDSLFNAKLGSANLAAQYGIPDSIAVTSERLGNRQFTSVIGAAEQGDHILGERTKHQVESLGEYLLIEIWFHLDHISPPPAGLPDSCSSSRSTNLK
jgi:hypothetical protein